MQAAALVPAALCLAAGSRCLKHAAVIVTPVGVEILPFLRAAAHHATAPSGSRFAPRTGKADG